MVDSFRRMITANDCRQLSTNDYGKRLPPAFVQGKLQAGRKASHCADKICLPIITGSCLGLASFVFAMSTAIDMPILLRTPLDHMHPYQLNKRQQAGSTSGLLRLVLSGKSFQFCLRKCGYVSSSSEGICLSVPDKFLVGSPFA
jgi:hypothetical protein